MLRWVKEFCRGGRVSLSWTSCGIESNSACGWFGVGFTPWKSWFCFHEWPPEPRGNNRGTAWFVGPFLFMCCWRQIWELKQCGVI
jgi:hypothetical protein